MANLDYQQVATGKDPRDFDEFERIRGEINKMTHPLHPPVDWPLVQQLGVALFTKNGVDLQSVVYYSMARTRLNGWNGFAEGCELMAVLIVAQWDMFWPMPTAARARNEMLDWFAARVGALVRQLTRSPETMRDVFRAEYALKRVSDKLQLHKEINPMLINSLLYFLQECVKESKAAATSMQSGESPVVLPLVYLPQQGDTANAPFSSPSAMQKTSDTQQVFTSIQSINTQKKRFPWLPVLFGAVTGCLLTLAAVFGYHAWQPEDPVAQFLLAAQPSPALMSLNQALVHDADLQQQEQKVLRLYQEKLTSIVNASPIEPLQRGQSISQLLQRVYPQNSVSTQWQQQLESLSAAGKGFDYAKTQQAVQSLLDELLESEKLHRGYMTISSLKTGLYNIQSQLNAAPPVTYLLTQLEQQKQQGIKPSPALLHQIDDQLRGLQARYLLLQAEKGDGTPN
ncbi:VasL domain-containing protein [Hafnia paralvei]|uniref:VasL domain-containing protein n=1 Tax=Hafnia paralvei TaxID=546367 RepID=UPI0018F0CD93|nr:VasL domain-containing protein [Hafnia paralvei]MBW2956281.1 type VI secretion system ImpA family N-terminal domain-containing protein [Hafnia paralvei]MBW2956857.1 type VI secretion system ImpA family N-terminal domain-containing protein [Hafnia paralvei]MCQ4169799.1 type VI secretion system ImpA family N-terminal domain-containing protein [Hafnia paralvei]